MKSSRLALLGFSLLGSGVFLASAALGGGAAVPSRAVTPAPGDAPPAPGVRLTVRVDGLRNDRGGVAVALFASAAEFPDQRRALAGQLGKITRGRASVTFMDVRPGVYAIAVLHDENQNAKMDFNFLGMPLEGYGFSNDAQALFGPPSFAAASFRLLPRASQIAVKIRYLF